MYRKKRDIDALLSCLVRESGETRIFQIDRETSLCEMKTEVAPGLGIAMYGEYNDRDEFEPEYYIPYMMGDAVTSRADCSIQRHTEKETYAGLLDELRVGISLIFYLTNPIEYRERKLKEGDFFRLESAKLAALSNRGEILLPIRKTANQLEKARVASRNRDNLLEAARNGDERAMESLTIDDIDTYTMVSRRAAKEDILSIVETTFMPSGIECDQYAIVGIIEDFQLKKNRFTGEEVYDFLVECNSLKFHVGINKEDLLGEPAVGRRFRGQIWMMGNVNFAARR